VDALTVRRTVFTLPRAICNPLPPAKLCPSASLRFSAPAASWNFVARVIRQIIEMLRLPLYIFGVALTKHQVCPSCLYMYVRNETASPDFPRFQVPKLPAPWCCSATTCSGVGRNDAFESELNNCLSQLKLSLRSHICVLYYTEDGVQRLASTME